MTVNDWLVKMRHELGDAAPAEGDETAELGAAQEEGARARYGERISEKAVTLYARTQGQASATF